MVDSARDEQIEYFLAQHLTSFERQPLAADASFRRYERIITPEGSRILMDAPPPKEEVVTFSRITEQLRQISLHAPAIYASDEANGFLLLEDLGGDSYTRHLQNNPSDEWPLYRAAVDALVHLHRSDISKTELPTYHHQEYQRELGIFSEWFLPSIERTDLTESFHAVWDALLNEHPLAQTQMVLRDYHADNLMWLPELGGLASVGLLDYQDAILGDPAYDLVSLLEDARRDVQPDTVNLAIDHYCDAMGIDKEHFMVHYALLGAQRNCKIIGIFNRLSARDSKAHYLDYLPRVWAHLQTDLRHPALLSLKNWFDEHKLLQTINL